MATATTMIPPVTISWTQLGRPICDVPARMTVMMKAPTSVPTTVPSPPERLPPPMTWLVELLSSLPADRQWMMVPPGVWLLAGLAVLTAVVLRHTRLGAHIFAIGSSENTARLCGVPVERVKIAVYTLSGALAGLTGVLQFSRLTVGDPTVAVGLELDVIAAVVIGGGSLSGGEGTVLGTLVGAFIMTVIRAGTSQMGLPNWVQEIVTGTIIVVAVAIDRWRHRRQEET